jgi:hypothetical protein
MVHHQLRAGMTDQMLVSIKVSSGARNLSKGAPDGRFSLTVVEDGKTERITAFAFKARHAAAIKDLEEKRDDVLENKFAEPLLGEVPVGREKTMQVQSQKRDDQLTQEEQKAKTNLLDKIDRDIRHHRNIVAGMNYLQVHYNELVPKLSRLRKAAVNLMMYLNGTKAVWSKGIQPAALYCIEEFKKGAGPGKSDLEICREFLSQYIIPEDPSYTPEQLCNNVRQIRQLNSTE